MGKLFGTDGIRKIESELTNEFCFRVGQAAAEVLKGRKVVIGRDTRESGLRITKALASGISSKKQIEIIDVGIVPTPAISYISKQEADFGMMISASHNPYYFNGIKIFDKSGYKLNENLEEKIEQIIHLSKDKIQFKRKETVEKNPKLIDKYVNFIASTATLKFNGIKVAIDAANGTNYVVASRVLNQLGAETTVINNRPSGFNINEKCGSTHPHVISKFTIESGADIGIAFDGDGDRIIAVDENGAIIDGDKILAILGIQMKQNGKLKLNTIVSTVMSNIGLSQMANKNQMNLVRTKVGDKYVLNEMLKSGYNLGGEQSGHIIMLEHQTTGDGLLVAVQLILIMKNTNKKLSELAKVMESLPQVIINANILQDKKHEFLKDREIKLEIQRISDKFKDDGRLLVRPSGTESLIRIMIEGTNESTITKDASNLANLIVKKFGT